MADINLTAPDDYTLQMAQAQRQQQLAQALQQMGDAPIQAQSAGGITAPISPLSVLAKALNSFGGTYMAAQAGQARAAARAADAANATKAIQNLYSLPEEPGQPASASVEVPGAAEMSVAPVNGQQQVQAPAIAPQQTTLDATAPTLPFRPSTPQEQMAALVPLATGGPASQAAYGAAMPGVQKNLELQQQVALQAPIISNIVSQLPAAVQAGILAWAKVDPDSAMTLATSYMSKQAEAPVPIARADFPKWGIDPNNVPPGSTISFNPLTKQLVENKLGDVQSQAKQDQEVQLAKQKRDIVVNNPTNAYHIPTTQTELIDAAIQSGRLDPNKLSSRTAAMYGQVLQTDPNADFVTPAGIARLKENPQLQSKIMTAATIPQMLNNLQDATNKLNYSNLSAVGGVQKWVKGQSNDPDLARYGPVRNDLMLKIAGAMRATGMSDVATRLEDEVNNPTMSPKAMVGYIQGQTESLNPMLQMYSPVTLRTGAYASGGVPVAAGTIPRVNSASDYAALPPKSQYVDPNGNVRTKQ